MNGCNDCKYKKGYDCTAPSAEWTYFDKDKGVEKIYYKSRSWQRDYTNCRDPNNCDDHEPKEIPLIVKWWKGVWG